MFRKSILNFKKSIQKKYSSRVQKKASFRFSPKKTSVVAFKRVLERQRMDPQKLEK